MSRGKELLKNSGMLFIAKASTQVVNFLLLPLYTTLLNTAEYGKLDIYSSLSMVLIPFITLQIEQAVFRYLITSETIIEKSKIISVGLSITITISVFLSVLYLTISSAIFVEYRLLLLLYYFATTVSTVLLQITRGFTMIQTYSVSTFLLSGLSVVLNVIFVAGLGMKVEGILLATVISNITASIYMIIKTRLFRFYNIRLVDKNTAVLLLTFSVPLIFNQIASWVINYSDRIIILTFLTVQANGIYSLACKFPNILGTLFGVYNLAWTENIVKSLKDTDYTKYVSEILSLTFKLYFCTTTTIINLMPFVFYIMVNAQYSAAYNHIPLVLMGIMYSGIAAMIGSIYIARNKTKEVGITTALAGITNLAVHLALIKIVGLYAASISTLVAFMVLCTYRYYNLRKFDPIKIELTKLIPYFLVQAFSCIAYFIKSPSLIIIGFILNMGCLFTIIKHNYKKLKNFKIK